MKRKPRKNKSPTKSPPTKIDKIERLSRALNTLSKAFDENSAAFSSALCYADAMLFVLRTALNDQLNGTLLTIEPKPGFRQVDVASYLKGYEQLEAERKADKSSTPLTSIHEDEANGQPVIFGGT